MTIGGFVVGDALRRAPVPAAAAVVLGVVLLRSARLDLDTAGDVALAAALAAFLGAAAGQGLARSAGAAVAGLAGAALVVFAEPLMVTRWLLVAALALAALTTPALRGPRSAAEAWRALVRSTAAAGLGILGALVVIGGVYLLAASAKALLGLDWSSVTSQVVAPLAFGWLAPAVFLGLSEGTRDERIAEALGLVAQALARFVLVPLLALYTLVLAVYIGRIALLGALPSNEIGWIVPLFGVSGALAVLALAARPGAGRAVRLFLRLWFPVTLVPVALYLVAIGIRVEAYGITPQRYLALLVGAWLGMLGLAFTLAPRGDVRLVPATLALLVLLGAAGPWSLRPVVTKSLGDRIAAHLPAGDVAAALRATAPKDRWPLCSPVAALDEIDGLAPVEARLGTAGLAAVCAEPWSSGAETLTIDTQADTVPVDGPAVVWGPLSLFSPTGELSANGRPYALRLADGRLKVRAGDRVETFDLVDAARAFAAAHPAGEPVEAVPFVVSRGDIALALIQLGVAVAGAERTVNNVTFAVIVRQR